MLKDRDERNRWHQEYRKRHPKQHSDYQRRYRRGIEPEQYDAMLAQQDGVCAICSEVDSDGRSLAVDHCHRTGKIRGLLCANCNMALGLLKDNIQDALVYLFSEGA